MLFRCSSDATFDEKGLHSLPFMLTMTGSKWDSTKYLYQQNVLQVPALCPACGSGIGYKKDPLSDWWPVAIWKMATPLWWNTTIVPAATTNPAADWKTKTLTLATTLKENKQLLKEQQEQELTTFNYTSFNYT